MHNKQTLKRKNYIQISSNFRVRGLSMEKLRISPVYRPYDICVQYKGLKLIVWTLISISRGQPYFKDCILTKKECCIMYDLDLPRNSGFLKFRPVELTPTGWTRIRHLNTPRILIRLKFPNSRKP